MTWATTEALNDPEFVRDLPPELSGGMTFHLPLVMHALEALGVEADDVRRTLTETELANAFARGLVDPPFYRWALDQYAGAGAALISSDSDVRRSAFAAVEPLGAGLAGAAFHGLIRLGYGCLAKDAREITRGLAYLRSRRQLLLDRPKEDMGLPNRETSDLKASANAEALDGATIFDQFNLVAADVERAFSPNPSPRELVNTAVQIFLRHPESFVAVHGLTSAHALAEFTELLAPGALSGANALPNTTWWHALEDAHAVAQRIVDLEASTYARVSPSEPYDTLLHSAARSGETHTVKVAASLMRLHELDLVDEAVVRDALTQKLHCADC
jgi:hypothetical protein